MGHHHLHLPPLPSLKRNRDEQQAIGPPSFFLFFLFSRRRHSSSARPPASSLHPRPLCSSSIPCSFLCFASSKRELQREAPTPSSSSVQTDQNRVTTINVKLHQPQPRPIPIRSIRPFPLPPLFIRTGTELKKESASFLHHCFSHHCHLLCFLHYCLIPPKSQPTIIVFSILIHRTGSLRERGIDRRERESETRRREGDQVLQTTIPSSLSVATDHSCKTRPSPSSTSLHHITNHHRSPATTNVLEARKHERVRETAREERERSSYLRSPTPANS